MGQLKLILLRGNVDTGDMETVDETNMLDDPSIRVGTWQDTKNDVKVVYAERKTIEGVS